MENTTNTALQNATVTAPATFNFKSAALNAYSREIALIGQFMADKNIQLAKVLGRIKTEKAYELDGFKSVSDFAEKTFGIKKSQAYQLANVGERFYNSDSDTAKKVAALLSPANMAEIANMKDEDIEAAIESGAISKDSTQKQLRETAKTTKETGKTTVEKMHDIKAVIVRDGSVGTVQVERMTLPAFENVYLQMQYAFEDIVSKKFSGDSKAGTMVYVSSDGAFAKVDYELPSPAKVEPKAKSKFTVEELMAMLEAAKAEQEEDSTEDEEDEEG